MHEDNYGVYGARKVWAELHRHGIDVARCEQRAPATTPCRRQARELPEIDYPDRGLEQRLAQGLRSA